MVEPLGQNSVRSRKTTTNFQASRISILPGAYRHPFQAAETGQCDVDSLLYVAGSLGEVAAAAFREAYGQVDPHEPVIDRPLSTLFALFTATWRPDFPTWAEGSLRRALDGDLERDLIEAIAVARTLGESTRSGAAT